MPLLGGMAHAMIMGCGHGRIFVGKPQSQQIVRGIPQYAVHHHKANCCKLFQSAVNGQAAYPVSVFIRCIKDQTYGHFSSQGGNVARRQKCGGIDLCPTLHIGFSPDDSDHVNAFFRGLRAACAGFFLRWKLNGTTAKAFSVCCRLPICQNMGQKPCCHALDRVSGSVFCVVPHIEAQQRRRQRLAGCCTCSVKESANTLKQPAATGLICAVRLVIFPLFLDAPGQGRAVFLQIGHYPRKK